MPKRDDFTVSVDQNVLTDLAQNRPWEFGTVHAIQVAAPAAATNGAWTLKDGQDVPFDSQDPMGTAISYDTNAYAPVELMAERKWNLNFLHAGAAAQDIVVSVYWD